MQGISGISQRIAEIQSTIGALPLSAAAPAPAARTAASEAQFSGALSRAVAQRAPSVASSSSSAPGLSLPVPGVQDGRAALAAKEAGRAASISSLDGVQRPTPGSDGVAGGELNAAGVPVELARYGNGQVPASALQAVGSSGHRLWRPAATALDRLLAAAEADGVAIKINDSYRSYDRQVTLAGELGLRSEGGLAARPGTSDHGWGMAVDLGLSSTAQAWMRTNAREYGFVEDVSGEPWHWGFKPALVS